ncbi:twin-arginine translocase subunit TatC, partial [Duncaniella muris]|uniref:twin-arginine translocase subunit TatC n=2 Tax=Muribaculaceae TaxID=2005473 RepID=UPI0026751CE6
LGKAGIVSRGLFNRYRRHAVVALLVAAAVITPTGDPFTLMVVFLPLYLLWELSALTLPSERSFKKEKSETETISNL